jgi:demethylmenaquinone methyltransferase/2-methoxy-6-polyprenyl-1,4-benzoquinol methylase
MKDPNKIQQIFSSVSQGYDLTNDVLSLGIHRLWRRKLVRLAQLKAGQKVLDCATGTGDLAILLKERVGPSGTVVGSDFNPQMLSFAPTKALVKGLEIRFEIADVMALPYETASFDVATISFGIRNVADPKKGLEELARVVKPGGQVLVLEFGQPQGLIFGPTYRWYSRRVLPKVGGFITGDEEAYRYLENSSSEFPAGPSFLKLARETHAFSSFEDFPLMRGLAHIYRLTRA